MGADISLANRWLREMGVLEIRGRLRYQREDGVARQRALYPFMQG